MFVYNPGCACIEIYGGRGADGQTLSDVWEYWHPRDLKPEVRLVADVTAAGLSRHDLLRIEAALGGVGFDDADGGRIEGATLLAWNQRSAQWVGLGDSGADNTLGTYELPAPARDFLDPLGKLHLRIVPAGGDGVGSEPSRAWVSTLSIDVEQSFEPRE